MKKLLLVLLSSVCLFAQDDQSPTKSLAKSVLVVAKNQCVDGASKTSAVCEKKDCSTCCDKCAEPTKCPCNCPAVKECKDQPCCNEKSTCSDQNCMQACPKKAECCNEQACPEKTQPSVDQSCCKDGSQQCDKAQCCQSCKDGGPCCCKDVTCAQDCKKKECCEATKSGVVCDQTKSECSACVDCKDAQLKTCEPSAPEGAVYRRGCKCCCIDQSCSNFTVNGTLTVTSSATIKGALTVTSGSNGIKVGTPKILSGSGAPTVSAPQGSLYLRTDGSSTSTRAYINTDGSTTWTAITTAA